ncbi:hypothetical protein [Mesorhizobium sp. LNJC394B00]|uniref:hypothetical protein n=1 Tax=unclassified Mesorhizobium TaxID=325217 RepID=UPI0003CF05BF|nr:hypothetical protein [Mesorhizobium sp. LNJC394B00]ESY25380.1 hypothetical protein X750_03130 [Mesorhizobium sp. LNJC394B00]
MKTLLIASMIAFAGTAALIAPAKAASLTIQSDDDDQYSSDDGDIQILRHHQRHKDYSDDYGDDYSDNQDGQWRRHHRHHRCHIELVRHWRHHHRVVEEVRVCG